jgi:GT2 family glycosyltransferase
MNNHILLSIAIISHGQGELVAQLLHNLCGCINKSYPIEIIIIENLSDQKINIPEDFPFPTKLVVNPQPHGLSSNLNQAFQAVGGEYFCTINPDIKFTTNIFPSLIDKMNAESIDIIAPVIVDEYAVIQDSFRSLPTPKELILRYFGKKSPVQIPESAKTLFPDWLAGMFLLMKSKTYRKLSGFDEKFTLYYEDVDFCCRAKLAGYVVALDVETSVIHTAQRKSQKNIRFFMIHLVSTMKFLFSSVYWDIRKRRSNY